MGAEVKGGGGEEQAEGSRQRTEFELQSMRTGRAIGRRSSAGSSQRGDSIWSRRRISFPSALDLFDFAARLHDKIELQ